jgi:hypothetical protein
MTEPEQTLIPQRDSVEYRERRAIAWLFSSEAGGLKVCEARALIRERFGKDVDDSLSRKFGK